MNSSDPEVFPESEYPGDLPQSSASTPNGPDLEILTTVLAYKEHGVITLPGFAVQVCLVR